MGLEIRKYGNKNFQHIDNVNTQFNEYGANDITIIFEQNRVRLRSFSGRPVLLRQGYGFRDVSVYDIGGDEETFESVVALKQRLINLGYPFAGGTQVVGGVESVVAGTNVTVDNTDPQNPIVNATPTFQEVKINGLYFDTENNTDVNAIEVGNTFRGWPTSDRYVVGKVLALPFDVDDETKVQLYIDN